MINCHSLDLSADDLPMDPQQPLLIISEIVSSSLIGEGLLPAIRHALSTFRYPNQHIIDVLPRKAKVWAQVVQSPLLGKWSRLDESLWHRISQFCRFPFGSCEITHYIQTASLEAHHVKILSEPLIAFEYDLRLPPDPGSKSKVLTIKLSQAPTARISIVSWFTLELAAEETISTAPPWITDASRVCTPGSRRDHWK